MVSVRESIKMDSKRCLTADAAFFNHKIAQKINAEEWVRLMSFFPESVGIYFSANFPSSCSKEFILNALWCSGYNTKHIIKICRIAIRKETLDTRQEIM